MKLKTVSRWGIYLPNGDYRPGLIPLCQKRGMGLDMRNNFTSGKWDDRAFPEPAPPRFRL